MTDETTNARELAEGKTPIPTWVWVVIAVLALLLACVCATATGLGVFGILNQSQEPDAPVIIVPPTKEQPAEQPAEQPTLAPPEQPTEPSPEQPTEPPPEQPVEQPPEGGQPPTEPDTGGSSCIPLAGGLVLAPLLVLGKKNGIGRRTN